MGMLSKRKGKSFEQRIARQLRERWPDALVRRSSQAERAYNADVFCEGGPSMLSALWLELHDARKPIVKSKLEQAERDVITLGLEAKRSPIVIWHKLGERTIQATMRLYMLAWLAYGEADDSPEMVTMDLLSFFRLVETASSRRAP